MNGKLASVSLPTGFFLIRWLCVILFLGTTVVCFSQAPANDDCVNAIPIVIPSGGFGLGNFTASPANLTNATIQTGESFAPAIFVAGLDKKSVWYKFSIPTIRAVRVTLTQPGTVITAGDAGFAVYQASNCLPGNTDISTKLTPIVTFGNTYHPCVPTGDYLIQVSAKLAANGPISVQLEISDQTGAAYDHPDEAYAFGTVRYYGQRVDFNTECQSIEDATEVCGAFANPSQYNKSAWLTFKTPAYFDYIVLQLSGTGVQSYFPSNNGQATLRKFGFTLYKGDAVTTPINQLATISGCDSLETNGYYAAYRMFKCGDLDTGTTYSIQLFIERSFADDVRWGILVGGQGPTKGPKPTLAQIPSPTNALGNLASSPSGTLTSATDVWGCNSRHTTSNCSPALPDTGIAYNGGFYNLSSFFTFSLTGTAAINFNAYVTQCGTQPLVRVFKQAVTTSCNGLDTANIIGTFNGGYTIDCLEPGNYTVQVSGRDYTYPYNYFTFYTAVTTSEQCLSNNLGTAFQLNLTTYSRNPNNKYRLNAAGKFDSINRVGNAMQPLADRVAYSAVSDTIGCLPTVRPADTTCSPVNDKVIYRQFIVNDSGIVDFSNLTYSNYSPMRYRLYLGDANALATAQNVFAFPGKITGLKPITECLDFNTNCVNKTACVVPGTYTFTTMAGNADVGRADKPVFTFVRTRTKHNTPFAAQDMGSLWDTLGPGGGSKSSDVDDWSCDDNAVAINGVEPCTIGGRPAKKAIYRQFYLNQPSLVRIENIYYYYCAGRAYGIRNLFYGKATDGFGALSPVGGQWSCFSQAGTTAGCNLLPAGWYTVVSYNQGPNYDSTFRSLNLEGRYNSAVGYNDEFRITLTPSCPGPAFNRPYKASVAAGNQPHAIDFVNRVNSTPAYPRTDTTYVLPKESFNCTLDTPFANHPISACETASNRVAYYVFRTTTECFLQINAGGYFAALYNKDIRTDSLLFGTIAPIQPCNSNAGYMQFCYFQPGTYTLVIFAKDANVCQSVAPSIYIDLTNRYSRFDYAAKAYDFGVVAPDSIWHYGKTGDVNPLNNGRAPSNDIFYCTTGASATDPVEPACSVAINPNVYNSGPNKPLHDSAFLGNAGRNSRRNIWYTFVIAHPGYVTVKVESKTPAREYQQKFSVYRSNVDGTIPFSTVVANGQVDSTSALGLTHIATNQQTWYYCANLTNAISFYRDPCTSIPTRYYVLVENVNSEPYEAGGTLPNTQTEVSILIDSVNLVLPKFDHYYQADDIGTVGVGIYRGNVDNYSCATKDAPDPIYYYTNDSRCQKTLWYKFTATITGNVRYRAYISGVRYTDHWQVQLFRQTFPGDSTVNGLKIQGYRGVYGSDNTYWAETCVSPGTYYIMLTGCGQVNEYAYPEIQLIEAVGDFCSRAVPAVLNGSGAVTASVLVDCHTIGTDYGEFGPQLTCPQAANTAEYKTSWFRMDIGGTDTLDVTAFLVENTNAASSDIKYRLMTGDCGAMQEQSCVLDALTQNTYQCLVPGQSYYVQVFTPIVKFNQAVTGTIELRLSAINHADTCAPLTNCLASANFTTLFDCNTDDSVKFVNFSTYGTSIAYDWDFGYNGQRSSDVSPSFFYPALATDQTYTVKLLVTNTSCQQRDSVTRTITIPGRPYINFGSDIASCTGTSVLLTATSFNGAVYQWNNGSALDTFRATATGNAAYWVKVTYNGCSSNDTVRVVISPLQQRPVQQIILCTDSVSITASRGYGETYRWITGATTASIFVSRPGVYWVDVNYFGCIYRDSFVVNNVATARPLGNDTTVCFPPGGYTLHAAITGATSYSWNNGSSADSLNIAAPGTYSVTINFGSCSIPDTIIIGGFPAPQTTILDTSICAGGSLLLLSGQLVKTSGTYADTLRYSGGCDSVIRRVNLTVYAAPAIGRDTTVCLTAAGFPLNATTADATGYTWQDGTSTAQYLVTAPGLYWVDVNFGTCVVRDSIRVSGYPAPVVNSIDTSICAGNIFMLPWGGAVTSAGTYRDTLQTVGGCDSVIQQVNLVLRAVPALGNDSAVSICSGNSFDLTRVYNTPGLTTAWTLSGAAVPNPGLINSPGAYRLVATNSGGCTDTAVLTLTLSPKPALGGDDAGLFCTGSDFNLGTSYNTAGLTANWTIGGAIVSNPGSVNIAGNYQLIATNSFGCSDTAIVTLTLSPSPVLGNDTSITRCSGSTVDLSAVYNTSSLNTAWTFGTAPIGTPTAAGTPGTYRLVVSNAQGCTDTAMINLIVNPAPVLGRDTTIAVCQGVPVDLRNIFITNNLTVNWTLNNQPVSNVSGVLSAGTYRLVAETTAGCSDTAVATIIFNPSPVLGNDTALAVCQGNSLNISGVYPVGTLTAVWKMNGSMVNPLTASTAGLYQLEVINQFGCRDTALLTLTNIPRPNLGSDSGITICNGQLINLTSVFNTTGLTVAWTKNGQPVTNPAVISTGGIYQLIATNGRGCTDTALVTVTVNPKPSLGPDQQVTICDGKSVNLISMFPNGMGAGVWTSGGNIVNTPAAVRSSGIYQLIYNNLQGCSDTALVTVNVTANPTLVINNPARRCLPQTADITGAMVTAGSVPGLSFSYYLDSAATSVFSSPASATDGVFYIRGTDASGCSAIAPVTVSSFPIPTVSAGDDVFICYEDSTTRLTALVGNTTAPVIYSWEPVFAGGIRNPGSASTIVTPVTPQEFFVTIQDGYGCNYRVSDTLVIRRQPEVPAFAGNDTIAVTGVPHQLQASGGVSYLWTPGNVLDNPALANPRATIFLDSMLFIVMVKDEAGCVGYDSVSVKVYDGITYYVPNAFSPNGDNRNDIFRPIPVGIVSTDLFQVYNRYGKLVFETKQWMKGWDGNYLGKPQPIGNYVWVLRGNGSNGKVINMKGNVVLVR